jgi:hypothetical protein
LVSILGTSRFAPDSHKCRFLAGAKSSCVCFGARDVPAMHAVTDKGHAPQFSFGEDQYNEQFTAGPFRLEMREIGAYADPRALSSWVDTKPGDSTRAAPIEISEEQIIQDSLKYRNPLPFQPPPPQSLISLRTDSLKYRTHLFECATALIV